MGKIITFYSYKGGVGRSFALANTAYCLAKKTRENRRKYKVLCVDWDLEAPGLREYFSEITLPTDSGQETYDLVDVCLNSLVGKGDWRDGLRKCHDVKDSAQIDFDYIPASKGSSDYHLRFSKFRTIIAVKTEADNFTRILDRWRKEWQREYDFILIDSRTGLNELASIATVNLADFIVYVFTANNQSINAGIETMIQIQTEDRAKIGRPGAPVLPLLSRLSETPEKDKPEVWLKEIAQKSKPLMQGWLSGGLEPYRFFEQLKIPHAGKWTYGERLSVKEESGLDPLSVSFYMERLATILEHGLIDVGNHLGFAHARPPRVRLNQVLILYRTDGVSEDQAGDLADLLRKEDMEAWIDQYKVEEVEQVGRERWIKEKLTTCNRVILIGADATYKYIIGEAPIDTANDALVTLSELDTLAQDEVEWAIVRPQLSQGQSDLSWKETDWLGKPNFAVWDEDDEFKRLVQWCIPASSPIKRRPAPPISRSRG